MKLRSLAILALCLVSLSAAPAAAQEIKPFNLALVPDAQIFDPSYAIHGMRLSVWSNNANMQGFDVGLVNLTDDHFYGLQWGIVGISNGDFKGWQDNQIFNGFTGVGSGVQTGVINSAGELTGVQIGFVNAAKSMKGFQLAVVNYTQNLHGLQIGLVCIATEVPGHSVLPIVNWSF